MSYIELEELNVCTQALATYMASEQYTKIKEKNGKELADKAVAAYLENFKTQYKNLSEKSNENIEGLINYMSNKGYNAPQATKEDIESNRFPVFTNYTIPTWDTLLYDQAFETAQKKYKSSYSYNRIKVEKDKIPAYDIKNPAPHAEASIKNHLINFGDSYNKLPQVIALLKKIDTLFPDFEDQLHKYPSKYWHTTEGTNKLKQTLETNPSESLTKFISTNKIEIPEAIEEKVSFIRKLFHRKEEHNTLQYK